MGVSELPAVCEVSREVENSFRPGVYNVQHFATFCEAFPLFPTIFPNRVLWAVILLELLPFQFPVQTQLVLATLVEKSITLRYKINQALIN